MKINKIANQNYEKPSVGLLFVDVERGFQLSGTTENVDKDEEVEF